MKNEIKITEKDMIEIGGSPYTFSKKTLKNVIKAVEIGQLDMCTGIDDIKGILEYEFGVKLCYYDVKRYLQCLRRQGILNRERVYGELTYYII